MRFLVVEHDQEPDRVIMRQTALDALTGPLPGLPRHMVEAVRESADLYLYHGEYISDYWFTCLIAVQARPGNEPDAVLLLRKELESIFMSLIFG